MASLKVFLIVSALILFSAFPNVMGHECHHDKQKKSPLTFAKVDEDVDGEDGRTLASGQNLRLYPYYSTLKYVSSSFKSYIRYDLVPPVMDYFSKALKVKYPVRGALRVDDREVCYDTTPSILRTTGVSADTFIYFTATSEDSSYLAVAQYCILAERSNRPLVAKVTFNTNWLEVPGNDLLKHEKNINSLIHELLHVLGFSVDLFPYFLDSNGRTRNGHFRTVSLNGRNRKLLDVPPLTSRLRRFFGCSSLPGAYLEDDGPYALTAGSHFERRFFTPELMSSGLLNDMKVSEFTFAVLEGSGWYQPNYDYADPYFFGAGQGCDFFTARCSNFEEFCTRTKVRGCSATGRSGGFCKSDPSSDNCMYYSPSLYFDCENPKAASQTRLSELQAFGRHAGSKCFDGTLSTRSNDRQNSFCFKYSCIGSGSNTEIEVQVGRQKLYCRHEGPMSVNGYYGSIECPDPLSFCRTVGHKYCPKNCMGRGRCSNNKCICDYGYSGVDCSLTD